MSWLFWIWADQPGTPLFRFSQLWVGVFDGFEDIHCEVAL
jgi:hypothetical protein